jgi:hypothetical protein
VPPADEQEDAEHVSRAPRTGVRLMIIIVIAMALLAIYANVQKARRDKIEQVTITPVSTAPTVSPSPGD